MIMIYSARHTQAVSFKSPMLILLGGIALYIDAIVNILLLNRISQPVSCYSSIVTTLIFHYVAYFSLTLRARRIFKIMSIEERYLDQIYDPSNFRKPKVWSQATLGNESVNSSHD